MSVNDIEFYFEKVKNPKWSKRVHYRGMIRTLKNNSEYYNSLSTSEKFQLHMIYNRLTESLTQKNIYDIGSLYSMAHSAGEKFLERYSNVVELNSL